jgi:2-oxoglutarate ferredoxin oxidoreductase subunit alpha
MRPFPKNLGEILKNYKTVLIPEINNGQLIKIIRSEFLIDAKGYNKIMGIPITKAELVEEIKKHLTPSPSPRSGEEKASHRPTGVSSI